MTVLQDSWSMRIPTVIWIRESNSGWNRTFWIYLDCKPQLRRQVQGQRWQGSCRHQSYCPADSWTGLIRRLHNDPHRFFQQHKPALEDFLFWGGQRSVINSIFLRWVALEQSGNSPQLCQHFLHRNPERGFRCPYRCLSALIFSTIQ